MGVVSMQNGRIQLNRIEPVEDIEINKSLFEMYANIVAPLRFVEDKMDEAKELQRQGYFVRKENFHSFLLFIGLVAISGLLVILSTMIYCIVGTESVLNEIGTDAGGEIYRMALKEMYPIAYQLKYTNLLLYLEAVVVVCSLFIVVFRYYYKRRKKEILLRTMENKYNQLQERIGQAIHVLEPYLQYVPPDYRNSYALQHFVDAYMNLRVSNVSEAVKEYDVYLHRRNMEQELRNISEKIGYINYIQKQSLATQRATLAQLNVMQGWMVINTLFSGIS